MQVQCDFKDVAFYIKKKTGFPKITDSGYADVFLGGKGLSGTVHLESISQAPLHRADAYALIALSCKVRSRMREAVSVATEAMSNPCSRRFRACSPFRHC